MALIHKKMLLPMAVALLLNGNVLAQTVRVADIDCEIDLCRVTATQLPLRVLPDPFSTIYQKMDERSRKIDSAMPALTPLYVYARKGITSSDEHGWYLVGSNAFSAIGWMKASELVEWHIPLVLTYTPTGSGEEQRNRVVGFASIEALRAITLNENREVVARTLLNNIDHHEAGHPVPDNISTAGVISTEPRWSYQDRDIKDTFYLWPVLSWSKADKDGDEWFYEFTQLVPECRKVPGIVTDGAGNVATEPTAFPAGEFFRATVMEYLGKDEGENCEYRGWISNRELTGDPHRTVDVNVMISHSQFRKLYYSLKRISDALATSSITGMNFIESLRALGATAYGAVDSPQLNWSSSPLPQWMASLPDQSKIASLTVADIESMTHRDRIQLEINTSQLARRYEERLANRDLWHTISKYDKDVATSKVTLLPLEDLP